MRRAITRNTSPDVPFEQSVNPYQGCEHGCSCCLARPSHAYWNLGAGLDFETRIFHKPGLAQRLAEELAAPGYACLPRPDRASCSADARPRGGSVRRP